MVEIRYSFWKIFSAVYSALLIEMNILYENIFKILVRPQIWHVKKQYFISPKSIRRGVVRMIQNNKTKIKVS